MIGLLAFSTFGCPDSPRHLHAIDLDDTPRTCVPRMDGTFGPGECFYHSDCLERDACVGAHTMYEAHELWQPGFCAVAGCSLEDGDGDRYASRPCGGTDCNDDDPAMHPGAHDEVGDGVDQNCDCLDGLDADWDGSASAESGGTDCNDADETIRPDAPDDRWSHEVIVETSAFVDRMAFDSSGAVHVLYGDGGPALKHVTDESGDWVATDVLFGAADAAMVVDADGTASVLGAGSSLGYATSNRPDPGRARTWTVVSLVEGPVSWVDLTSDALGTLHAVYVDQTRESLLHYGTIEGSSWTAIGPTFPSGDASLAVDRTGSVLVAHVAPSGSDVSLDEWVGGTWVTEHVDAAGYNPILRTGPDDEIHLSYAHWDASLFGIAGEPPEAFERVALAGGMSDFVVDEAGGVHVTAGSLYGARTMGEWAWGRVDLRVAYSSSIAIDGSGTPRIVYDVVAAPGELCITTPPRPDGIDQDCDGSAY